MILGKAQHYYVKAQVGLFEIENNELNLGDKILISGPTTGNEELVVEKCSLMEPKPIKQNPATK